MLKFDIKCLFRKYIFVVNNIPQNLSPMRPTAQMRNRWIRMDVYRANQGSDCNFHWRRVVDVLKASFQYCLKMSVNAFDDSEARRVRNICLSARTPGGGIIGESARASSRRRRRTARNGTGAPICPQPRGHGVHSSRWAANCNSSPAGISPISALFGAESKQALCGRQKSHFHRTFQLVAIKITL